MKKLLSSPEVIAAMITVFGTLLVGIILGVAEGKIGFTSLLAVVAALALILLVYLLYKRSGARVTALALLIMLVVGFAGFSLLRPRPPTTPAAPTPTVQVAARPTATPVPPPISEPTRDAPAAPPTPKSTVPSAVATATLVARPTAEPARPVTVPNALIGIIIPPGPAPAAVTFADGALWVADNSQRRLYRLDEAGGAAQTVELKQTELRGLAWDGQNLLLAADNYGRPTLVRLTLSGDVLTTIALPLSPTGLCWNPVDSTLWTGVHDQGLSFLVHLTRDCDLIETVPISVFGGPEGLTCDAEGFWIANPFGEVFRYSYSGVKMAETDTESDTGTLSDLSPALDDAGNLYLAAQRGGKIFQFSTRQDVLGAYPTAVWEKRDETPLPRPAIVPLEISALPRVSITNGLAVPLTVALDRVNQSEHEAGVLQPSETWTRDVPPGVYKVFASTSGQGMLTFSSNELLIKGYQFTWVVSPPQ